MTTFLGLCQRLNQESGIPVIGPSTVIGQTGQMKRSVDWIASAYEEIQSEHADWQFLRADFSFPTVIGTVAYLPSAISLPEHADWITESITVYTVSVADEQELTYVPWDEFRENYQLRTVTTGRPYLCSVKPDRSLALYPTPDAVYTVRGEYYKRAQTMTADASEPLFPARFHMILVWRALMLYGAFESAAECYSHGSKEYLRLFSQLEANQLPRILLAGPLA